MNTKLLIYLCLSGLAMLSAASAVLPAPKTVQVMQGNTKLGFSVEADEVFKNQALALAKALEAVTAKNCSIVKMSKPEKAAIQLTQVESLPAEGYIINTSNGVLLQATTPTGMARATATFLQLVVKSSDGEWQLPKQIIKDHPDYSYRSFLVDMGRNPHSPETLRRVIDMMWLAKVRYLHLHLTDDQLFSFPSTAYPNLLSKNAGWTINDWHEIEAYSQARGVTIIPELEAPGHSGILRKEYPDVFGKTTTELATLDSAFEGLTTILTEMMDVFKATPYIHIGCDEAYGVKEELQRDLVNRLHTFVKRKGRQTIVWEGPKLGVGKNKVNEEVIHMNWRSIEIPAPEMVKAGYRFINANWDPFYVVDHYPRTMFTAVPSKTCYNVKLNQFKHINHGFKSFSEPIRIKKTDQLLGYCMAWWEGREYNLFVLCRQRLNAVNARAWNDRGEASFDSFLVRDLKLKALLETISPWTGKDPTGGWGERSVAPKVGNLAHGKPVTVSVGASQPHFGPARLTNGVTDRFDHFLGFPTVPKPLEITIDLGKISNVTRAEIYEAAVGNSWEKYQISTSTDNAVFTVIGKTEKGSRGASNKNTFTFPTRKARYIRLSTNGCQDLTFSSFSRLCEVMVFEK